VIVNVIGAAGERPSAGYIAGSAGNASLMAFTRGLGGRSRADNIRVVAINPGLTRTDRMITLMRTWAERDLGDPERWEESLDADFPPTEPEEIAAMVAFLASDLSASTTGTVITIDGGSSSR
jgi:NAD(P)-dependent dehydrogenase (short-subunit alcohol dehydrogenase family)